MTPTGTCPTCGGLRTISLAYDGIYPCPDCGGEHAATMTAQPLDDNELAAVRYWREWPPNSVRYATLIDRLVATIDRDRAENARLREVVGKVRHALARDGYLPEMVADIRAAMLNRADGTTEADK